MLQVIMEWFDNTILKITDLSDIIHYPSLIKTTFWSPESVSLSSKTYSVSPSR
jgi:hypothetical protein